jgi:polyvinyl alcohol dehydrogenase (cytochrome)
VLPVIAVMCAVWPRTLLFAAEAPRNSACAAKPVEVAGTGPAWNGWGGTLNNARFVSSADAELTAGNVPGLKLKWAFAFPGDLSAYSQPVVFGGRLFVGSAGGTIYSLDTKTGCGFWSYDALSGVRAAIVIAPFEDGFAAYAADQQANVYAVNASTGKLLWKTRADAHPQARITGSPQFYKGVLYVPVASGEEWAKADPDYECCTFRGSVAALDARTGKQIWKTYTIPEAPKPLGKTRNGKQRWGPSGVSVWGAPAIDPKRNALYIGTGESTSEPESSTADAILAMDLDTGKILWAHQLTENSLFRAGCVYSNRASCPDRPGPDHDFTASPVLRELSKRKRVLIAGQKSGLVHALDPDDEGEIVWQQKIGKGGLWGGVEWGPAADENNVYVPLSDLALENVNADTGYRPVPSAGGGLFALRLRDGKKVWSAPPPPACARPGCSPAQSAAAAVIPGVVFSGALDGVLRAYSTQDGSVLWQYDTARDFPSTVNGAQGKGGGIEGPSATISGGMVFVNSGFGQLHGMPGNVLLAFGTR